MKTLKTTLLTCTMLFVAFASIFCKDAKKKESAIPISNEMNQETMNYGDSSMSVMQDEKTEAVLHDYFNLKDALVNDDNGKAKELGNTLVGFLRSFDVSNYSDNEKTELNDIIEDATEHAEHIGESDIKHQREHFKILSQEMIDMLAITGTENTLYEQYCPMYDNNKGGIWLSMNDEIKNPYFGSKMLTCGKVQREIN